VQLSICITDVFVSFPCRAIFLQGVLYCDRMEPEALANAMDDLVAMEEAFIKNNPGVEVQRLKQ